MKDFLYAVLDEKDEYMIFVSPNYEDCLAFAKEVYKCEKQTCPIEVYNYQAHLKNYLNKKY